MINNLNSKLNSYLKGERISKIRYDDLKYIAELTNFNIKILDWFRYLHEIEIEGWRNKKVTQKICNILMSDKPIQFYSLFCPSYIKAEGSDGFRTDDVGNTTKKGLKNLEEFCNKTKTMGFKCLNPEAIFFDLSLEQPEKTINKISDLKKNIENFKKYVPKKMKFCLLSERFPELYDIIGYKGVIIEPLPIDETVFNRIVERGGRFYKLFGWDQEQIIQRSKVIASSESTVGTFIRNRMPNSIMLYTPTMLERAQVYSGKNQDEPLAIIMPKK